MQKLKMTKPTSMQQETKNDVQSMEQTEVSCTWHKEGKGQSSGAGGICQGAAFNGTCSRCGSHGHRFPYRPDCTIQTNKERRPYKAKTRVTLGRKNSAKTNSTEVQKGKSGGRGRHPNFDNAGCANPVGGQYAPATIPPQQNQPSYPQLMAMAASETVAWSNKFLDTMLLGQYSSASSGVAVTTNAGETC